MSGLPVVLSVSGWRCVVVGLGRVGSRKANSLILAGADVTTIDPSDAEAFVEAEHLTRPWQPGDCAEAQIVVIATNDAEVNERAGTEAKAAGALVLRADRPAAGDLSFPAVHRAGPVTVAIDSGGASPALSVMARDMIDEVLGKDHENWRRLAEWAAEHRGESSDDLQWRLEEIRGER